MLVSDTATYSWTQVNDMLLVDSNDNAIVMVSDCRHDETGSNLSYSAYKISPEGEMLWGDYGVDIHRGGGSFVACMKALELEDGSFVFVWQEGITYDDETFVYGIRAERVSADGELLWDEPLMITTSTSNYECPMIENAGSNQFIIVYAQGGNDNIYARKVDFDGSSVWAEDTKVYVGGFNSSTALYMQVTTTADTHGGVFIAWYADPYYTGIESPYLSYVKPDGTLAFVDGTAGLKMAYDDSMRALSLDVVYNEIADCVYAVWRGVGYGSSSYQSINIQKVTREGEVMWDETGFYVEPTAYASYGGLYIENAEDENFAIFYSCFDSYLDTQNRAAKFDSDANYLWDGGIYSFAPYTSYKGGLTVSPLINNEYWLVGWQENRTDDIYAAYVLYADRVYLNGTASPTGVAEITSDNNTLFAAKTADGSVTFATNNNEAATITIYTVAGEVAGVTTATNGTASYSTTSLAAGVYIARLTSGSVASTTRFVVK